MSQSQGFRQQTEQRQVQNASSVQVLLSSLIEMPLADFETRLQNELLDNEALEVSDHEENDGANYQNEEGNHEAWNHESPQFLHVLPQKRKCRGGFR